MGNCFSSSDKPTTTTTTSTTSRPATKSPTAVPSTLRAPPPPQKQQQQQHRLGVIHQYDGQGGSGSVSPNTRGYASARNSNEMARETTHQSGVLDRKFDFAANTRTHDDDGGGGGGGSGPLAATSVAAAVLTTREEGLVAPVGVGAGVAPGVVPVVGGPARVL